MKIETTGFYDMAEADYHADPAPEPSLNSTLANAILEETEIEAMLQCRRFNPEYEDRKSDPMDLGNMAHEYVLMGTLEGFVICEEFDDWRKNAAKERKAEIEAAGKIALNNSTKSILDDVKAMKEALHKQIAEHREWAGILQNGKAEQCGFAHDGEIWNRARFDWIDEAFPDLIVDYKTTGLSFDQWEKNELWGGKYMQSPHYRNVYDQITGKQSKFIWLVQRTKAPYLVKIFTIDDSYTEEVQNRYLQAQLRFKNCLKTGQWRGEPPYTAHSYPPPWILQKWDFQKLQDEAISRDEKKAKEIDPADALSAG